MYEVACVLVEPMSEGEIGVYEYQNSCHAESIRTGVDVILIDHVHVHVHVHV